MWGAPGSKRRVRRASIPALAAFFAAASFQFSACALVTSAPPQPAALPPQGHEAELERAAELTKALAERDRGLDSMQTPAVMEYSNPDHHIKAREVITVRRPEDLRIEAMSPFGVALVVAARDSKLAIFRSSDNTLMRGAANAATLDRFARVPLAPKPAVDLLMGLAPDPDILSASPESVHAETGVLVAVYRMPDGGAIELGFSGDQLAMVRRRPADGSIGYEVHYADYRDIGGLMMAYRVEADFPAAQTRVAFRYERPIVNGTIADSMFQLSPGPSTKEIDLDSQVLSSAAPALSQVQP